MSSPSDPSGTSPGSRAPGSAALPPAVGGGPSGLLIIDKPIGPTSMDICRVIKRRLIAGGAAKKVKVGHGGTLDPLATGILVVLVGRATKLCEQVMADDKAYLAEIDLSAFSSTDDAEGQRTPVAVATPPSVEQVRHAATKFVGLIQQTPPVYSAIKIDGQEAYKYARKGEAESIQMQARTVRIDAITVLSYQWPHAVVEVVCGKGVYIRSLARDLGAALGTGGMLSGLRRTRIGQFDLGKSRTMESLPEKLAQEHLADA